MTQDHQRQKSHRLITTTPDTSVGAALKSVKPDISPKLLEGLEIQKVSSSGVIAPRILTLSEDLFTLFVSHHKVGNVESLSDRFHYKGFKAYAKVVKLTTGSTVQAKRHLRVIDVTDVLFVQSGYIGSRKLEACKEKKPDLDPSKVISVFHNNMNTTDFLVEDEGDRKAILDAIQIIRNAYNASRVRVGREELLLRYAWYDTDWDKSGLVDKEEFLQLLARINIYLKQEKAIRIFKAFVAAKYTKKGRMLGIGVQKNQQALSFDDCLAVLRKIKSEQNDGKELMHDVIFDDTFGADKTDVSVGDFLTKFLHQKQHERDATTDDVKKIFSELNSMELSGSAEQLVDGKGDEETIDRARFGEYLSSSRNDLYDPQKQEYAPLTLTRPMSEYWINSSHNTYLVGDQLKSFSSVEMYALSLQRGCKCIELDCWDDSDGYPIIYHGYTITSKIPFQDVISCVRAYIDEHPDTLPIILSLENHCSHSFQEQMANILQDTLEEQLHVPVSSDHLPSPLDLMGKVVIKGKRPPEKDEVDGYESSVVAPDSVEEERDDDDDELADQVAGAVGKSRLLHKVDSKEEKVDPPPLPKISPELARLTLLNGVKFKHFDESLELPLTDMHSINETKILKILNNAPENESLWKKYNKDHMTRTYPAGSRVDSSNYNPVLPWHVGSQLVALNFQTDDSWMTINDGRFRENGACGYVLKPPSILSTDEEPDSGSLMLKIKVLSGSCLPKPYGESVGEVIDPYVVVSVHDVEKMNVTRSRVSSLRNAANQEQVEWIQSSEERKTSSIRDNGFCPQWNNSEEFEFTVNSDAAVVEFVVMDSDKGFIDDCMCKSAVPVSCLRQGLRSVQFYDQSSSQHGPFGFARILVDVDIKHMV